MTLLKSILHNLTVVAIAFGGAFIGRWVDGLLGMESFSSPITTVAGCLLIMLGFMLRVWAAVHFYRLRMNVISLEPQAALITSGPYQFSRNPLYLGGNVFMFFGAGLVLGSPGALALAVGHLPLVDRLIRREERQLEQRFSEEWTRYKSSVRRWI